MEKQGQQQGDDRPTQQQSEDHPSQQEVEMMEVDEVDNNSDSAALRKEAQDYLREMARSIKYLGHFCRDMQAAVNQLSTFDVRQHLFVTHTCDHIKEYLTEAKQQSEIYINVEKHNPDRTRKHVQKMAKQLFVFRKHRNRIVELYLTRMPIPEKPNPQTLGAALIQHMSLLQDDVQRLLQMAKGELPADDDQARAAGQVAGPSQPAAPQG